MTDGPDSEDVPVDIDPLDHTLESAAQEPAELAVTTKRETLAVDRSPRSIPRPAGAPKPLSQPPPAGARALGADARPPSIPPIGTPRSGSSPDGSSRPPSIPPIGQPPPVQPLVQPPLALGKPRPPAPAIAPDDAPTIPGALGHDAGDEQDVALAVAGASAVDAPAPPSPTVKPRRGGKKPKRRTVRIPDDEIATPAATTPVPAPVTASSPLDQTPTEPVAPVVSAPRQSAPGVLADEQAIFVVRSVEIVSELPPVPSAQPAEAAPPSLASEPIDEIEEVLPERVSLPGPVAQRDLKVDSKRPLPPPRSAQPAVVIQGAPAPAAAAAPAAAPAAAEIKPEQSTAKLRRAWWMELFEDDMVRTLDNPRQRDVEREAAFIAETLRPSPGAQLLDLGCGHGVHAVELASRGFQVVAVDLSATMLALAKQYCERRAQRVNFVQGDMRQLELDAIFDGIYCWSGTFGYFDDATNANVLERMVKALKPGGKIAIDVANRDYVAPRSPSMAWFEKPGCVCMDEARFDFFANRLIVKRMVMFDNGKAREIEYSLRLYSVNELGTLMQQVGLKVVEVSGHRAHRGAYFGSESPRIIMAAEK